MAASDGGGRWGALALPGLLLVVAVILGLIGASSYSGWRTRTARLDELVEVEADVTRTWTESNAQLHATYYFAEVRFTTEAGDVIEGKAEIDGQQYARLAQGQPGLPLAYAASAPDRFAGVGVWKDEAWVLGLFAVVLLPMSALVLAAAAWLAKLWWPRG